MEPNIGSGGFGDVYQGTLTGNGESKTVAVKIGRKNEITGEMVTLNDEFLNLYEIRYLGVAPELIGIVTKLTFIRTYKVIPLTQIGKWDDEEWKGL